MQPTVSPKIPGIGPIGAAMLIMKTPAPELFRSGRQFAAWIGLTPRDHSTGGKVRLGVITRAGDELLRTVLVVGGHGRDPGMVHRAGRLPRPGSSTFSSAKPPKLAAVALANKMARVAWKLMVTGRQLRRDIRARRSGERDIEISQTRGATQPQPC